MEWHKIVNEMVYKGMLGYQELYQIPEYSDYIESLSDDELEKPTDVIWNNFVKLVKSGKIKVKRMDLIEYCK